jgi:8-oxo-dGTP diphosphatase
VTRPPQAERGHVVAAGAIVIDRLGRVLLVRRGRPPAVGEWTLPGGHVEEGESPEAAAVRELREETTIDGRVIAPLGVVEIAREGVRYSIHEYLVMPMGDGPALANDDAADVRWAHRGELESIGVRDDAIAVVDRGLALRRP